MTLILYPKTWPIFTVFENDKKGRIFFPKRASKASFNHQNSFFFVVEAKGRARKKAESVRGRKRAMKEACTLLS